MDYLPVDIQLLQSDVEKTFRLYILLGNHFVPYSDANGFTEETRTKLLREGIRTHHIRMEDRHELRDYMNQSLQVILSDPSVSEEEKSRIVYDTCTYQLERLGEAPEAKQIEQCKEIFRQSVDHVLSATRP